MENKKPFSYYFSTYRTAIRYHLARVLREKGFIEAPGAALADIQDEHISLNPIMGEWLEHKHRLAQLIPNHLSLLPLTYPLDENNAQKVLSYITYEHYIAAKVHSDETLKWILKPSLLNNGAQIKLFNHIDEIRRHYASPHRLGGWHVIQHYINNPHLIDNRKYTFRIHLVLTNYAGAFLHQEGYINICGKPFNDNLNERKAHITNYMIEDELAGITQQSTTTLEHFPNIFEQMGAILRQVINTLTKKEPHYLKPNKNKQFEIFGCDFMLDANQKLWLLEINQGPDAPMFEDNPLKSILWQPFWQRIVDNFVLPLVHLNMKPTYAGFKQISSSQNSYKQSLLKWFRCH